jgi:hypothetical protein
MSKVILPPAQPTAAPGPARRKWGKALTDLPPAHRVIAIALLALIVAGSAILRVQHQQVLEAQRAAREAEQKALDLTRQLLELAAQEAPARPPQSR